MLKVNDLFCTKQIVAVRFSFMKKEWLTPSYSSKHWLFTFLLYKLHKVNIHLRFLVSVHMVHFKINKWILWFQRTFTWQYMLSILQRSFLYLSTKLSSIYVSWLLRCKYTHHLLFIVHREGTKTKLQSVIRGGHLVLHK